MLAGKLIYCYNPGKLSLPSRQLTQQSQLNNDIEQVKTINMLTPTAEQLPAIMAVARPEFEAKIRQYNVNNPSIAVSLFAEGIEVNGLASPY